MGNSNGIIVFLTVILTVIVGGFVYFYMQFKPAPLQKAVECRKDENIISFLIDDDMRNILMAGKALPSDSIKIFNKTAISASWASGKETTSIFLDRVSGKLEIEMSGENMENQKDILDCSQTSIRF